jgi:hypothetical protein
MPVIQVETSVDQILQAVKQLSTTELDTFLTQVIALRARHQAESLSDRETALLTRINQGLSTGEAARYAVLIERRDTEVLSSAEHNELVTLSDELEILQAERVKALIQLADVRGISLDTLMQQLGIGPIYS